MNFQHYFEKLNESKEFKKFKKEHPNDYFCSAFFSIDKEGTDNQQHFDFFNPKSKEITSFKLGEKIEQIPLKNINGNGKEYIPEKINEEIDFDFNYLENLIEGEMFIKKINKKINKIIFSLQTKNKREYLFGSIFLSGLAFLRVTIDLKDKKIIDFENKSFFDMIKFVKRGD